MDADSHFEDASASSESTQTAHIFEAKLGATLGPYRLIRQLGEGGMGVVYHAQQLHPIRRDVALKIIKPGMDSKQVIARFESERQALAMMDHTNIARVFEAGTTVSALPYFLMELVDGAPITRYCDSNRLSIRQRIELFIPVCQAIQHAHQKGIIHRDIKPSNILVGKQEDQPIPKVIDFGLAKALGYQLGAATMMTNLGTVVGTFSYMSPEQAELGRQDIDTRSDIYSLGAVLYELLTGTTPLGHIDDASYAETLRRICEEPINSPSARLLRSGNKNLIAEVRQTDPAKLPKAVQGELDWITMKALEKDRARRYETVNGLARDLRRYLEGEPVEAAPPSTAYRVGKFVRRYRVWLGTAAAFAALLIVGVVISVFWAVRARRAEAEAQAVNEFLQRDLLGQASAFNQGASAKPDPTITVRTALDRAAAHIDGKFPNQPLVEASIRQEIGSVYVDLSVYREAERQYERALAIRRRELGDRQAPTLATMSSLAAVYERSGKPKQAEPLYREVLELDRRILGEQNPDTLKTTNGLAATYLDEANYGKAEALLTRLVPMEQRVFGERNLQTLRAMGNLAAIYVVEHKDGLAEPLLLRTLDLERASLGEENPETLETMGNLGGFYLEHGEYAKSEPLQVAALAAYRRVLGDGHPSTINTANNLAELSFHRGNYAEAEALYTKAVEAARLAHIQEHPVALYSLAGMAECFAKEGHLPQAASLLEKVLETQRRVLGSEHPDTLETLVSLAQVRLDQQLYLEAESSLREALASYQRTAPDDWQYYDTQALLGASLAGQKKFDDAERLLISGYHGMVQRQQTMAVADRPSIREASDRIVKLYRDWREPDKAAAWEANLALK